MLGKEEGEEEEEAKEKKKVVAEEIERTTINSYQFMKEKVSNTGQ